MGLRFTALFSLLLLVALHVQALSALCVQRAPGAQAQNGCCTAEKCGCCEESGESCRCGCAETQTVMIPAAYFCPDGCETPSGTDLAHFHVPDYLPERNHHAHLPSLLALEPGTTPALIPLPLLEPPEPPPRLS